MNDRRLLYASASLRAMALGMMGPLLGFRFAGMRVDETTAGVVSSIGLLGAALPTVLVMVAGDRLRRRTALLGVTLCAVGGGVLAAFADDVGLLAVAALLGMLNAMGRDRGACMVVEHAILPDTASDADRTKSFAWYSVFQDGGTALGGALVALPKFLRAEQGMDAGSAMRTSILFYAGLLLAAGVPYALLSARVASPPIRSRARVSPESRSIVMRICALFAIDSVAGGFITSAFLTAFFVARFHVDEGTIAALFFAKSALNAVSHLGAAWLAKRIGLVNTMVFTHIPSSVLLMTVTIAPSFPVAAALFLLREGLVEMDVPTRSSYVMAVVRPEERAFASAATHLTRMAGWAAGPALAGLAASTSSLALPLLIAGGMKIVYDLLLWRAFRHVRPPEERGSP